MRRQSSSAVLVRGVLLLAAVLVPATCASQGAPSIAATVGELVRLEAQHALLQAQKAAVQPPAPSASSSTPAPMARIPEAAQATDVVELLGIAQRGQEFFADIGINGAVRHLKQGDHFRGYFIKSIGTGCANLLDPKQQDMLRCVAMKAGT